MCTLGYDSRSIETLMSTKTLHRLARALGLTLVLTAPLMHTGAFDVMNVTVRLPDLVALALIVVVCMKGREGVRLPACLLLPMVAYALANVVSAAVNWGRPISSEYLGSGGLKRPGIYTVLQIALLGFSYAIAIAMLGALRSRQIVHRAIDCLALATSAASAYGLIMFVVSYFRETSLQEITQWVPMGGWRVFRVQGTDAEPSFFCAWLLLALPVMASAFLNPDTSPRRRVLHGVGFHLALLALLLSFSSSGIFASFVVAVVFVCLGLLLRNRAIIGPALRREAVVVGCVGLAAVLVMSIATPHVARKLGQYVFVRVATKKYDGGSAMFRSHAAAVGMYVFRKHWRFGVGPGRLPFAMPACWHSVPGGDPAFRSISHANDLYVDVLAELGIVGFATFVWLCAAILAVLWTSARRSSDQSEQAIVLGLLCGIVGWLVQTWAVDNFYRTNFWIFVGLSLAAARQFTAETGRNR